MWFFMARWGVPGFDFDCGLIEWAVYLKLWDLGFLKEDNNSERKHLLLSSKVEFQVWRWLRLV